MTCQFPAQVTGVSISEHPRKLIQLHQIPALTKSNVHVSCLACQTCAVGASKRPGLATTNELGLVTQEQKNMLFCAETNNQYICLPFQVVAQHKGHSSLPNQPQLRGKHEGHLLSQQTGGISTSESTQHQVVLAATACKQLSPASLRLQFETGVLVQ